MLEGGARIDARDFEGATPLPRACSNTCFSVVKSFTADVMSCGADEKLTNEDEETPEEILGRWGDDAFFDDARRKIGDRCIRHMLARAPADRSWRRRGWLVLARSCPTKVQLAQGSETGGGGGGGIAIPAKASKPRRW